MIAETISNIKQFTKLLFLQETFDTFLVSEISITTYNTFHIDGSINREFYTEEEFGQIEEEGFSSWKTLRPFCFSIIKGRRLPLSFKIVLRLSNADVQKLIEHSEEPIFTEIDGLFLNLLYKNETLTCVSGTSYKQFTLDRTVDKIWDHAVTDLLDRLQSERSDHPL